MKTLEEIIGSNYLTECCNCGDYRIKDKWVSKHVVEAYSDEVKLYRKEGRITPGYCIMCLDKTLEEIRESNEYKKREE